MSGGWKPSERFITFLSGLLETSDFAARSSEYYPFVGWSLGGSMQGPNGTIAAVPARYEIGFASRTDVPPDKIRIASKRFGYIVFDPNPEDAASFHRLIDFDGTNIFVR